MYHESDIMNIDRSIKVEYIYLTSDGSFRKPNRIQRQYESYIYLKSESSFQIPNWIQKPYEIDTYIYIWKVKVVFGHQIAPRNPMKFIYMWKVRAVFGSQIAIRNTIKFIYLKGESGFLIPNRNQKPYEIYISETRELLSHTKSHPYIRWDLYIWKVRAVFGHQIAPRNSMKLLYIYIYILYIYEM